MLQASIELLFFSVKFFVVIIMLLILLSGIVAILTKKRRNSRGGIQLNQLNKQYKETENLLLAETLTKTNWKNLQKKQNKQEKLNKKSKKNQSTLFILNFQGDIKASAVDALREEVTAILTVFKPNDEVFIKLESSGGMVHGYGLAAAQLQRLKDRNINLTIAVDKVAASGGYMMACMANHLIAAPFAIIGSIGVILQLPNFNRLLKKQNIDFEQITAGQYKRTLTIFGPNTNEGRKKSHEEIESIHNQFRDMVKQHRNAIDIEQVSTGEHWTGNEALSLKLIDQIGTSDEFILNHKDKMRLLEVNYQTKKSLTEKFTKAKNKCLSMLQQDSLPW